MSSSAPDPKRHEPVLLEEVLALLKPQLGQVVVDGTLGSGGHAREILQYLGSQGRLIGIDQDPDALKRAKQNLQMYPQIEFIQDHFTRIDEILTGLNLPAADAVLLDIGVSTEQLEDARRGFSFLKEGPLDMRMDPGTPLRAQDLVNDLSQEDLEKLFRTYGEERWARRVARRVVRERATRPIETTTDLVRIVQEAVPRSFHFGPRHPAMRVFQALRISVNEELKALEEGLPKALQILCPGGRLAVICFHSLEDRIVKQTFRSWAAQAKVQILTRKPLGPKREEIERNPRSRSAKLRGVEKIA